MKSAVLFLVLFVSALLCFSQKTDTIVTPVLYLYVDEMPKYEGGHKKIKEFIDHNFSMADYCVAVQMMKLK